MLQEDITRLCHKKIFQDKQNSVVWNKLSVSY